MSVRPTPMLPQSPTKLWILFHCWWSSIWTSLRTSASSMRSCKARWTLSCSWKMPPRARSPRSWWPTRCTAWTLVTGWSANMLPGQTKEIWLEKWVEREREYLLCKELNQGGSSVGEKDWFSWQKIQVRVKQASLFSSKTKYNYSHLEPCEV